MKITVLFHLILFLLGPQDIDRLVPDCTDLVEKCLHYLSSQYPNEIVFVLLNDEIEYSMDRDIVEISPESPVETFVKLDCMPKFPDPMPIAWDPGKLQFNVLDPDEVDEQIRQWKLSGCCEEKTIASVYFEAALVSEHEIHLLVDASIFFLNGSCDYYVKPEGGPDFMLFLSSEAGKNEVSVRRFE